MNKLLRFGIVGTNFVSDSFMEGVAITDGVEVVAVCSGRKENAIRFASRHQIKTVFDSYQEMAQSNQIDAVYIATPNSKHIEHATYFLNSKIPVFLEKPMAVNDSLAQSLFELAKKNNVYLHDGIMPLYSPNFTILKQAIEEIGPVRRAIFSLQKYSSRYDAFLRNENPTTFRKELANGAFMDLGIYTVANAVALFGKPHTIESSAFLLSTGVDGLNTAVLHYDSFDGIVMNSKITNTGIFSEIQGERGFIQFDAASTLTSIILTKHGEQAKQLAVSDKSLFHHQLTDFVDSISNHRLESKKVPHQLSIDILETLTKCRKNCGVLYNEDSN